MQNSDTKNRIRGVLFIAWSCLIVVFTVIPDEGLRKMGVSNTGFRWDYLEHLAVFFVFAVLYLQWRKADPVNKRIAGLIIIGILFAASTELLQLFIQSRSFNYIDLLFNIAGLPLGILINKLLIKIF